MEIRFDGKRALVTGAGKGIGKDIAIKLALCGADVIAISRTQSDLDELVSLSDKIQTVFLDIGDWENTKAVIQNIGPVDLLVNNAAIASLNELGTITEEDVDKLYDVNIKAAINITQIVAKGMKEKGVGGSIVNISSIGSFQTAPRMSIYCSSKAALDQLTRCMAVEYGPHKIRVNSVNPTYVRTNMAAEMVGKMQNLPDKKQEKDMQEVLMERTPLRRTGEVEDISGPVLFLLSDRASLITGVVLPIDGGLTVCF